MASKKNHLLLFFLLYLHTLSLQSLSWSPDRETDYQKWVSWNLKNYQRKFVLMRTQAITRAPATGMEALDTKLRNAEMKKVKMSVSQDGSGEYQSIQTAIDSIPLYNKRRVILEIKPGVYSCLEWKWDEMLTYTGSREKIAIPRSLPFITFLGDSKDPPMITGNDTASVTGRDGKPLQTIGSATVAVNANYFIAINIRFENTAPHDVGSVGEQAVALRVSGDRAAFYNCSFYGTQDTLYDHKGLHYFNNCFIQGSVDFIFGYGRSLYENCHLNSITTKVASITAQKRSSSSLYSGFSFKDCVVTASSGHVYLGRAWGDHSRVVFSYTYMDKLVLPQGWSDWGNPKRDKNVYYGEYRCSGPGANWTGRVPWARILEDEEAKPFIGTYYVDGDTWLLSG